MYRFRLTALLWNRTSSNFFNVFHQCGSSLHCLALLFFPVTLRPTLPVLIFTGCLFILITKFRNHDTNLRTFLNETAKFLHVLSDPQPFRPRRVVDVGLAALAPVGLFGNVVAMGSSNFCGLGGFFGSCQDKAKAKTEKLRRLLGRPDTISNGIFYWHWRKIFASFKRSGGPERNSGPYCIDADGPLSKNKLRSLFRKILFIGTVAKSSSRISSLFLILILRHRSWLFFMQVLKATVQLCLLTPWPFWRPLLFSYQVIQQCRYFLCIHSLYS